MSMNGYRMCSTWSYILLPWTSNSWFDDRPLFASLYLHAYSRYSLYVCRSIYIYVQLLSWWWWAFFALLNISCSFYLSLFFCFQSSVRFLPAIFIRNEFVQIDHHIHPTTTCMHACRSRGKWGEKKRGEKRFVFSPRHFEPNYVISLSLLTAPPPFGRIRALLELARPIAPGFRYLWKIALSLVDSGLAI